MEKYSKQTHNVLRILRDTVNPNDYYGYIGQYLEYLLDNEEIELSDLPDDFDPDMEFEVDGLSPEIQALLRSDDFVNWIDEHNQLDGITRARMGLTQKKLLNRQTWLIHFSKDADSIKNEGFTIGAYDPATMALTTYNSHQSIDQGYNFAFDINDTRYLKDGSTKYGNKAVMFQNSGVKAFHYGDEENQVMFWGEDVSPSDMVLLAYDGYSWEVIATKTNNVLFTGDIEQATKWVDKNYFQYRKVF